MPCMSHSWLGPLVDGAPPPKGLESAAHVTVLLPLRLYIYIETAAFRQGACDTFTKWQGLGTMLQLGLCRTQLRLPAPIPTISPTGCLVRAHSVRGSLARLQPLPQRLLHLANASDSSGPHTSPPAVGYHLHTLANRLHAGGLAHTSDHSRVPSQRPERQPSEG